jgi:hypothetical protein
VGTMCSMFVTARSTIDLEVADAARRLGLDALPVSAPGGRDHDGLRIDGRAIELGIVERSHPHPREVRDLVEAVEGPALLVADRISSAGRDVLRDAGWSWLDRRGHLRLWVSGLRVEAAVDLGGDDGRGGGTSPWTPVGLEVALHALCHPDVEVSARRTAAAIGRSVGGTQEMLSRFVDHGLIGRSTRLPLLPDLFWEAAAQWPDDGWLPLGADLTSVVDVLSPAEVVRVDERAATLGGARIPAAADLPARAYLTARSALRRVRSLAAGGEPPVSFVRVAPVRWLPDLDGIEPDDAHPWRVAHPVVCALRLARDPARGREVVEAWGIAG